MKTISMILGTILSINAWAIASGDVDTSFNNSGYLSYACNLGTIPPMGEGDEWAADIHVFNDQSMLVAGNAYLTNEQDLDMVVIKISNDGLVDTNFGSAGCAVVSFNLGGDNQDEVKDMVVDSNTGDIYLVGEVGYASDDTDMAIAKLTSTGALDTTFSDDGKQRVFFDDGGFNRDTANSAMLFGNALYVVGSAEQTNGDDFAWAKILLDGSIDSKLTYDLAHSSTSSDEALKVVLVNISGSMWVLGSASDIEYSESPAVIQVDPNGDLYTGFSGDGKYVYPDPRTGTYITDVTVKNNGFGYLDEFAFVGRDTHPGTSDKSDCSLVYMNAAALDVNDNPVSDRFNFNLDPNPFLFDFNSSCKGAAFSTQGKLVLTGLLYSDDFSAMVMGLMRFSSFNVTGGSSSYAIDNGFGLNGRNAYSLSTEYGSTADNPAVVALDYDDKILMAGSAEINGVRKTAMVRVIGDGGQDPVVNIIAPSTNQFNQYDPITFTATALDPEDGNISSDITWNSNIDGLLHTGNSFTTNSLSVGIHMIWANVTDSEDQTGADSVGIEIINFLDNPFLSNIQPVNNSNYVEGTAVVFSAVAFDDEDGDITANITWHSHIDGSIGTGGQVTINTLTVGEHVITIQIIDSDGMFDDEQLTVFITEDDVIFKSDFDQQP